MHLYLHLFISFLTAHFSLFSANDFDTLCVQLSQKIKIILSDYAQRPIIVEHITKLTLSHACAALNGKWQRGEYRAVVEATLENLSTVLVDINDDFGRLRGFELPITLEKWYVDQVVRFVAPRNRVLIMHYNNFVPGIVYYVFSSGLEYFISRAFISHIKNDIFHFYLIFSFLMGKAVLSEKIEVTYTTYRMSILSGSLQKADLKPAAVSLSIEPLFYFIKALMTNYEFFAESCEKISFENDLVIFIEYLREFIDENFNRPGVAYDIQVSEILDNGFIAEILAVVARNSERIILKKQVEYILIVRENILRRLRSYLGNITKKAEIRIYRI